MKFVVIICLLASAIGFADANHLLLTEICVTPTGGEFIEIYNPLGTTISLTDIYLCDVYGDSASVEYFYPQIVSGPLTYISTDFVVKFPNGSSIDPGGVQTIAMNGADFTTEYGIPPDFDLAGTGGTQMATPYNCYIGSSAGLTNGDELVVLFLWDGVYDLCYDIDYAFWGDNLDRRVDKTGLSIDGPDGDTVPSVYLNDTANADQDGIATGGHSTGFTFQRVDMDEGTEILTGGNGTTGHDETSENLSVTWLQGDPTPGYLYTALVRQTWGAIKSVF